MSVYQIARELTRIEDAIDAHVKAMGHQSWHWCYGSPSGKSPLSWQEIVVFRANGNVGPIAVCDYLKEEA